MLLTRHEIAKKLGVTSSVMNKLITKHKIKHVDRVAVDGKIFKRYRSNTFDKYLKKTPYPEGCGGFEEISRQLKITRYFFNKARKQHEFPAPAGKFIVGGKEFDYWRISEVADFLEKEKIQLKKDEAPWVVPQYEPVPLMVQKFIRWNFKTNNYWLFGF